MPTLEHDDVVVVQCDLYLTDQGWLSYDELVNHKKVDWPKIDKGTKLTFAYFMWTVGNVIDDDPGLNFIEVGGWRSDGPEFSASELPRLFHEGYLEVYHE